MNYSWAADLVNPNPAIIQKETSNINKVNDDKISAMVNSIISGEESATTKSTGSQKVFPPAGKELYKMIEAYLQSKEEIPVTLSFQQPNHLMGRDETGSKLDPKFDDSNVSDAGNSEIRRDRDPRAVLVKPAVKGAVARGRACAPPVTS